MGHPVCGVVDSLVRLERDFRSNGQAKCEDHPGALGLLYLDRFNRFMNGADFRFAIIKLIDELLGGSRMGPHPLLSHPEWGDCPSVYFRCESKGYELGLEVETRWWEKQCETGTVGPLAKLKTHSNWECDTTQLVVATLPYSEFHRYLESDVLDYEITQARQCIRDQTLAENGWKRTDDEVGPIPGWGRMKHEYFKVIHRDI